MRDVDFKLLRLAAPTIVFAAALAVAGRGDSGERGARLPENAAFAAPIMVAAISTAHGQPCVPGGESAANLAKWGAVDDSAIPTPCPTPTDFPGERLPGSVSNIPSTTGHSD
jgi:hypothetical protein